VVLQLVTSTLHDLRLAIAGTIALSDELLGALDALFNARVSGWVAWNCCALGVLLGERVGVLLAWWVLAGGWVVAGGCWYCCRAEMVRS
jgi:hypothetical protein